MNFDAILTLIKSHPAISMAGLPVIGAALWHIVLANWKKLLPMALKIVLRHMKREDLLRYVTVVDEIADEAIKDLNAIPIEVHAAIAKQVVAPVSQQANAIAQETEALRKHG
jgi:hypothetical protein